MEELDPKLTSRALAFELWIGAPMPMVTLFKTLDVTRLETLSRRRGLKFNMLLCWCAGKAASRTGEFFTLPVEGKLIRYDHLAVNTVVADSRGGISTCDIPFSENPEQFQRDYLALTALPQTELDGAVNIYAGFYNNPFLIWGKYRKGFRRTTLPISFQFHHAQMDGGHAARFLEDLQEEIRGIGETFRCVFPKNAYTGNS